jgi:4-amino-4-deoxy-L-arabinose transferase-like glycosyltransferase
MKLGAHTPKQSIKHGLIFARSNTFFLLSLIIALAFFLRIYRLQEIPSGLFIDEISGVYMPFLYAHGIVDLSLRGVISYFLSGTFFVYSLAGPSPFFTRLPEALLGTLLVFVVYLLAKEMFSKRVGLFSALLIAVCPWGIHFSRFQAYSSSYVLLFTIAMMLLYKGINSNNNKKKQFIWYCFGTLMLGLTAEIFASAAVFVPIFIMIFLLVYHQKRHLRIHSIIPKGIVLPLVIATIFIFSYLPIFLISAHRDGYTFFAKSYSTYSHSQNFLDWIRMIVGRAGMHLSPNFLVFTFPYTHDLPFQQTISKSALLRYSPTAYGELNYYGILLYPGIVLLIYEWISKRSKKYAAILWWITCYSLISGIAYYDNPNAARNIVGMPALIITIALFIDFLVNLASKLQIKNAIHHLAKPIISISLAALVTIPTVLFLYEYFVIYPNQSAKVFDYGYREVADFLSANNLWRKDILINGGYDSNITLSFFSPAQPPIRKIYGVGNIYGIAAPLTSGEEFDSIKLSFIEITRDITPFNYGTIDYETRIDKGYGGPTSSSISLINGNGIGRLSLTIYHNTSSYAPNNYLLLQSDNNNSGKSKFDQRPLNQTIEYGKWYKVRLKINSTTIAFYFDGRPITTLSRPSGNDVYTSIHLIGESAAVSFKNMIIEQNNQFSDLFDSRNNNLFYWKTVSGGLKFKQDSNASVMVNLHPLRHDDLFITPFHGDLIFLSKYDVTSSKLVKEIYDPSGGLTFLIFEITLYDDRHYSVD